MLFLKAIFWLILENQKVYINSEPAVSEELRPRSASREDSGCTQPLPGPVPSPDPLASAFTILI